MQPEVIIAVIAGASGLGVSALNAYATFRNKITILEVKNEILEFKDTFVDRLNGRYIRKPERSEDWPVTKLEHQLAKEEADREHKRFDREIQALQGRGNAKGQSAG